MLRCFLKCYVAYQNQKIKKNIGAKSNAAWRSRPCCSIEAAVSLSERARHAVVSARKSRSFCRTGSATPPVVLRCFMMCYAICFLMKYHAPAGPVWSALPYRTGHRTLCAQHGSLRAGRSFFYRVGPFSSSVSRVNGRRSISCNAVGTGAAFWAPSFSSQVRWVLSLNPLQECVIPSS